MKLNLPDLRLPAPGPADPPEPAAPLPAAEIAALEAKVGRRDFYLEIAQIDPKNRARWIEMAAVQTEFQDAEPHYSAAQQIYSRSMRLSLHQAVIDRLRSQGTPRLYPWFIALHPALFLENGAYRLPPREQLGVLSNARASMLTGENLRLLIAGLLTKPVFGPDAARASHAAHGHAPAEPAPEPSWFQRVVESGLAWIRG